MKSWICPECGNPNNLRICEECGFEHKEILKKPLTLLEMMSSSIQSEHLSADSPIQPKEKKKKKSGGWDSIVDYFSKEPRPSSIHIRSVRD